MALSFLSQLGGIAQQAGGIYDILRAGKTNKKIMSRLGQITPEEQQAQALYGALMQPNNSLVKSLTDTEMQANTEAMLSQLRAMQLSDRRGLARGRRQTFFDPERADETIDFLVSRGMPAMRQQAEQTARSNIQNAASGYANLANFGRKRLDNQNRFYLGQQAQNEMSGGLGGKISNAAGSIEKLLETIFGGAKKAPSSKFIGPMPYEKGLF